MSEEKVDKGETLTDTVPISSSLDSSQTSTQEKQLVRGQKLSSLFQSDGKMDRAETLSETLTQEHEGRKGLTGSR